MIRKVYDIDSPFCREGGGQMRIIASIEDHKIMEMYPRIKLFC